VGSPSLDSINSPAGIAITSNTTSFTSTIPFAATSPSNSAHSVALPNGNPSSSTTSSRPTLTTIDQAAPSTSDFLPR
jgi:hypothetical protein